MNEVPPAPQSPVVAKLAETQPWMRFLAILALIGTGFMILASIVMGLMGMAKFASGGPQATAPGGAPTLIGMAIAYFFLAFLYLFPGLFLLRAASQIRSLSPDAAPAAVAEALEPQRRFWKFIGITAIVFLVLYLLAIVAVVLFAVLGAASRLPNQN